MKNECKIVSDLLPLYIEDMVSIETKEFIEEHLKSCDECKGELSLLKDTPLNTFDQSTTEKNLEEIKPLKKVAKKINLQINTISYLLVMFFIFFGFLSMNSADVFYNSLIMPIVGVFGYVVFRLKAFYKMPVLLLIINLLAYVFNLADVEFLDIFFWTIIFTIFVFVGIIIAFLIHFAFKKEEK